MKRANGGARLRVVVDTNVYVSAFLHTNRPIFQIYQQAARGGYHLLTSPDIVRELGKTLREKFQIVTEERIERMKAVVKIAELIIPQTSLHVIKEDDADNRILRMCRRRPRRRDCFRRPSPASAQNLPGHRHSAPGRFSADAGACMTGYALRRSPCGSGSSTSSLLI